MFIFLIKEFSNRHIYNCTNNRYLIIEDDGNVIVTHKLKISKYNTYKIYTNNKKELLQSLSIENKDNIYDVTIQNFIKTKKIDYYTTQTYDSFNSFYNSKLYLIPNHKIIELFDYKRIDINLSYNTFVNNTIISNMIQIEKNNINIDIDILKLYKAKTYKFVTSNKIDKIYSNYTLFSKTLRPTNNIYNLNFMSLNKKNNERSMITTQFEKGFFLEIDFNSYHLLLLSKIFNIDIPTEYNNWHTYLGERYYFNTTQLTNEQYRQSKIKNFRFLYDDKQNNERNNIEIFQKADILIEKLWEQYNLHGYIESPFNKIKNYITNSQYVTKIKIFNYYIQLLEMEMSMMIIHKILKIIDNVNIKLVMYNYDSFLFDIDEEHHNDTQIKNIFDMLKELNLFYDIKIYDGNYT